MSVSVWNRATGNLNDMRFHTSIYFTACRSRIWADIIPDDVCDSFFHVRSNNICYSKLTNSVTVSNLGVGKPCPLLLI
ncbi:hypothetical protein D3Z53_26165 [Lachnospiraceae bacterium]|nr:hypothetical protein [Lachnospiraceae bacterium]